MGYLNLDNFAVVRRRSRRSSVHSDVLREKFMGKEIIEYWERLALKHVVNEEKLVRDTYTRG